jgi:hypothetical protein
MTDPRDKRDGDPPALAAAVSYGVSDFAGGVLTRRAHVFVVFLLSQLVSFALLLVVVAL